MSPAHLRSVTGHGRGARQRTLGSDPARLWNAGEGQEGLTTALPQAALVTPTAEKHSLREAPRHSKSNTEAARELGIGEPTDTLPSKTLYHKIGADNDTHPTVIATEAGLFRTHALRASACVPWIALSRLCRPCLKWACRRCPLASFPGQTADRHRRPEGTS